MMFCIPSFTAFVLPFLERLLYRPRDVASIRVLVITPTRELAQQIHVVLEKLAQVNACSFLQLIFELLLLPHRRLLGETFNQLPSSLFTFIYCCAISI